MKKMFNHILSIGMEIALNILYYLIKTSIQLQTILFTSDQSL